MRLSSAVSSWFGTRNAPRAFRPLCVAAGRKSISRRHSNGYRRVFHGILVRDTHRRPIVIEDGCILSSLGFPLDTIVTGLISGPSFLFWTVFDPPEHCEEGRCSRVPSGLKSCQSSRSWQGRQVIGSCRPRLWACLGRNRLGQLARIAPPEHALWRT